MTPVSSDMIEKKYQNLLDNLRKMKSLAVAFSGGVDSTFLLKAAKEALAGNNNTRLLAITARSCLFPARETQEAIDFCKKEGIRQLLTEGRAMEVPGFLDNPPDRCYLCKKDTFGRFLQTAKEEGFDYLAEGSNMDDTGDYRPGMRAIAELGIISPLKDAGLYKEEIRLLSARLGLPTHNKPSYACLASRIPYGETISTEKLSMIEKAEAYLMQSGFKQMRVRAHGSLARIEVLPADIDRLMCRREEITKTLKGYGFSYVTADMQGYRTGSMNEVIL